MAKENTNIELRSEKVRNIIGQIPPRLMRIGISSIFLVFISVLIGTYFFEYDYTIKTTVELSIQKDSVYLKIKIPANQIDKIKKGQKINIHFDNIPNMYGQSITTTLNEVTAIIDVSNIGGNYISDLYMPKNIKTDSGISLEINSNFILKAEIQVGKIRFFDKIFEQVHWTFKKRI